MSLIKPVTPRQGQAPDTLDINMTVESLIVQGIDHRGFAIIDAYSPCPTFNKVNTFKFYRDEAVELPKDHDPSSIEQAWARAQSQDPLYLGVLYRDEQASSFEENIEAAKHGAEADTLTLAKLFEKNAKVAFAPG